MIFSRSVKIGVCRKLFASRASSHKTVTLRVQIDSTGAEEEALKSDLVVFAQTNVAKSCTIHRCTFAS